MAARNGSLITNASTNTRVHVRYVGSRLFQLPTHDLDETNTAIDLELQNEEDAPYDPSDTLATVKDMIDEDQRLQNALLTNERWLPWIRVTFLLAASLRATASTVRANVSNKVVLDVMNEINNTKVDLWIGDFKYEL